MLASIVLLTLQRYSSAGDGSRVGFESPWPLPTEVPNQCKMRLAAVMRSHDVDLRQCVQHRIIAQSSVRGGAFAPARGRQAVWLAR